MGEKKLLYVSWLLRISVAFAFLYPPIAAYFDPYSWSGYFPQFLIEIFPNELLLLHLFGALEIVLGVWILSGWKVALPSSFAGALLVLIVIFNIPNFDVLFRDLSIAFGAFALVLLSLHNRSTEN